MVTVIFYLYLSVSLYWLEALCVHKYLRGHVCFRLLIRKIETLLAQN